MKRCPDCKQDKPLDDYYVVSKKTGRRAPYCKPCTRRLARERYRGPQHDAIKTAQEASNKARREGPNADCVRAQKRAKAHEYRYGLAPDEYAAFVAQPCAICDTTTERRGVDHCHISGANRGALCHRCNVGLGMYQDDADRLRTAAAYLDQYA